MLTKSRYHSSFVIMKEINKNRGEKGEKEERKNTRHPWVWSNGRQPTQVNSYSYSIQFRESAFRPPPMLLLCCHYSCRILSFSSAFLWWWLRNGENQPYECSAFRHQRTLKLAPFEPQKENAGGSIGVYFFYFSRVFFLRNQLPTHRLLHTNKTEDIKKHLMTYQTLFCSDGGGWADARAPKSWSDAALPTKRPRPKTSDTLSMLTQPDRTFHRLSGTLSSSQMQETEETL